MLEDAEELSTIAAAIAGLTDDLAWLEVWLAKKAMECGYPGVIARHMRQSRWRIKRLDVMAKRFPHLVPSNKEAVDALLMLSQVEVYSHSRREMPDPEIPFEIYRLAAKESEEPVGASVWIRLVKEQALSLRKLEKLIKHQKGEDVAIPYMSGAKMTSRVEGGDLILSPADGEPWEPHGEAPEVLVVTAIEVEHKEDSVNATESQ